MDALSYLAGKNRSDYQRDNFDAFLDKIKFHFDRPAIHIAGTNGKGSTATFLKDIYIANGYKVGYYNSPNSLQEMIMVNDKNIPLEYIEKIIDEYHKLFDKYDLSKFEIETFIAFQYFMDEKVDLAVIECLMGGEYDATNIFTPVLSIITSISIEHSDYLGVSFSDIALHKAGIIKDNIPALIGKTIEGDALQVIVDKCKETDSKLYISDETHHVHKDGGYTIFDYRPYYELKIRYLSTYALKDAALAVEATNILKESFPVFEDKLKAGLAKSFIKCRFEIVNDRIILDGAHNPEGIVELRKSMDENFSQRKVHVLFAAFKDKNISLMLPEISLLGDVTLTTFDNARAREQEDYFLYLDDYHFNDNFEVALNDLANNNPEEVILVTGSLTFTYLVRDYLIKSGLIK